MRQLSKDMKTDICEPTVIFEDNQSAKCIAKIPSSMAKQNILVLNITLFKNKSATTLSN